MSFPDQFAGAQAQFVRLFAGDEYVGQHDGGQVIVSDGALIGRMLLDGWLHRDNWSHCRFDTLAELTHTACRHGVAHHAHVADECSAEFRYGVVLLR